MASKGSRTISLILALVMVLGLFPSMSPSASAEFQEFDPASVFYGAPTIIPYGVPTDDAVNGQASVASGIPTTGLVDGQADAPVLTELVPQHVHHFVYSAEGNTIVARCDAEDCPLENGEAKLILKTDDAAKTDSVYASASIQNDIPLPESAVLGPVVYYVLNEAELAETGAKPESFLTEENRLEIAPKRVGTYLAAVTLTVDGTDYTVWNIFEIYLPKAVFTVRPEPVEGLVYDGQPHALVTPGDAGGSTVLYAVLANDETEPTDGFDDTFPMAADAGLYVVWFRAAGDADHEDSDTDHVVVRIQKASQAAPAAPEAEVITTESITLKASEGYEYSMDGENWQSDNTFGGLTANTEYRFFQRITGDYNLEPSPAGEAAVFCTLEDAPVVEEEPEAVPVKLWLVCDPPETVLTVRSSAEGSSPVSPEEDGSYLLLPGSWICSAAAEGYQPIENSELTISAVNGDTQYMTLELQKLPPVISPAFEETAFVSGMAVRVSAPEGVFPEGSTLSVTPVPVQEQQFVDAAVGSERGGSKTVMVSYTFDIKVLGPDGNEVQPADAQKVKVSFTANAVAEQNLNTDVYHVSGEGASLSAERLDTVEDGTTVTAETSGFSYYTVEFTYDTLQYVLPGGQDVALSEILNTVGLSGEVTGVTCSRPDLFSADTRSGEWVVYSHQPFTSTEWMKVVINSLEYTIIVTDDSSGASTGTMEIRAFTGMGVFGTDQQMEAARIDKIVLNRAAPVSGSIGQIYFMLYKNGSIAGQASEWRVIENTCNSLIPRLISSMGCLYVSLTEGAGTDTGVLRVQALDSNGNILSEKDFGVEVKDTPVQTMGYTPNPVVIDRTKGTTAVLKNSYVLKQTDSWWYTLPASFPGVEIKRINDNESSIDVRLYKDYPAGTTFTINYYIMRPGDREPVAWEAVSVLIIDGKDDEIHVYEGSNEINEIVINKLDGLTKDLKLSCNIGLNNPRWAWDDSEFENYSDLRLITTNPQTGDTTIKYYDNLEKLNKENHWNLKPEWTLKIRLYEVDTLVKERSIPIRIIDPIKPATDEAVNVADAAAKAVADAAPDETVKAADSANKASKESSSSGSGSGSSSGGSTPVTPVGGGTGRTGNKLEQTAKNAIPIRANDKLALDLDYFRKHANELDKQKQLYKLSWITYTDKDNNPQKKLSYMTGICNHSAYTTLLNRFVAYQYGDYSSPVKAENILYQHRKAVPEPYTFYKTGGTAETSFNKDKTLRTYVVDGKEVTLEKYKEAVAENKELTSKGKKKKYNTKMVQTVVQSSFKVKNSTATKREGWITNAGLPLPQQDFVYENGNYSIKVDGILTTNESKKSKAVNDARKACRTPEMLAYLLTEHPEGIYIHAQYPEHAVVITDCKETKNAQGKTTYTFYVIDPATNSSDKGKNPQAMPCTDPESTISPTSSLKINQIDHIYYLYDGKDAKGKDRTIDIGAETLVKRLAESKITG